MKKVITIILLLFLVLPVFADDLQSKWEEDFSKTPVMVKLLENSWGNSPDDVIKNDYKDYLLGKNSFYTTLDNVVNSDKYYELSSNDLNKKYIDLLLDKYCDRLKAVSTHIYIAGVISISDAEYKKLDDTVKSLLSIYNYIFAQDL